MKRRIALPLLVTLGWLALAGPASAAVKTYQVTGPVLEVNDTMIAVQKGQDRWEIARDASTKVTGDLKVERQGHDRVSDDRHGRRHEGLRGVEEEPQSDQCGATAPHRSS